MAKNQEKGQKFWARVDELIARPVRKRPGVSLGKIQKHCKGAKMAVVGDKVLGVGNISMPLDVVAPMFSESAKKAIENAGGKALTLEEGKKANPSGKGAVILA